MTEVFHNFVHNLQLRAEITPQITARQLAFAMSAVTVRCPAYN